MCATLAKGYVFGATESVTNTKLHLLVDSGSVGAISNADIANDASIADSKLATISSSGKVSGAAITTLTSVPSGAGEIPVANIPTGTTANKVIKLNSSAQIPAVDGSLLTAIPNASQSDMETATSTVKSVTPAVAQSHPSAAKFWVHFNGNETPAVIGGYNVTSITDGGVGSYTINFTTAFSDTKYCVVGSAVGIMASGWSQNIVFVGTVAVGSVQVLCCNAGGDFVDPIAVFVVGYGDQ